MSIRLDVEPIANELRGIGTLLRALAIMAEAMSIRPDALAVLSELVHGHVDVLAAMVRNGDDEPAARIEEATPC
jgi:hypothetical protein